MSIFDKDEKQQVVIGEAAMNIIFSREEVSLGSLINQLQSMAGLEEDDDRLLKLWEARKWLLAFKKGSITPPAAHQWLSSPPCSGDAVSRESDIHLDANAWGEKPKR